MSFRYSRVKLAVPIRLMLQEARRGQQRAGGSKRGVAIPVELLALGTCWILTTVEGLGESRRRVEV